MSYKPYEQALELDIKAFVIVLHKYHSAAMADIAGRQIIPSALCSYNNARREPNRSRSDS
jgi:hypothetical protein